MVSGRGELAGMQKFEFDLEIGVVGRALANLTVLGMAASTGPLHTGLEHLPTPRFSRYCTRPLQNLSIGVCHILIQAITFYLEWMI